MLPQKRGRIPSRVAMNCYWKVLPIFLLFLPSVLSLQPAQPRVLLVSFDGFRWDYIYKVSTPNFHYAMENGVRVKQVTNVFITKTYPNHYTMVTGLYAESHGVVANEMYDPILNETFSLNKMDVHNSKFWEEASPIWVTNQKEGHKTGAAMWPGTDVKIHGVFPTYYMPYNESVSFEDRVARLIDWFTSEEPINFGLLYWEQPDEMGHVLGPDNPQMGPVISDIDKKLGYLISELKKAKLWGAINVIITSDHGMSQSSSERLIELDQYVNRELYTVIDHSPAVAILPKEGKLGEVYEALASAHPNMTVYKKEQIPDRLHYKHNRKIQPILAVADKGWEIVQNKSDGFQLGNHGYDNILPEMHPIFVAVGPAFQKNATREGMNATDLYPLLCHLLGINPLPNNGSFSAVKDLLAEEVPVAPRADTYATVIGVFLGGFLVIVFIAVFVKHFVLTQANTMQMQHPEAAQPLLQD
ncbi:PREDICTED: ectonucleotide pyrophosphatase/phosphodiesterase family member 5 [Calidris pugnax]|uniref:ectonucleotide pyrophosphatase/phosphodiesterase family member 5 n=1 Tax=Calidris pugnax TaxID=198806 RepID=UPI00071DCA60|nr:PREDICTED: ectonucleotide pyrophosphatase/phosphodiesterase family member 5 [Calidris pugnax]XP_014813688.1 PREDICTED: ectonucleotide pyrophosphatase/phosphodiesterase family member 5 [Calidris pugnax]XP_014813689.1 PREDICTED: ectonucleotide pyrophosphatase/phosphodiesterase family member 5 [Calidris pugnax]XP_014813690.1 PREDICTED: ectonucleotide pyrophosphatase/phosphodiesterase family member 5 [Calidris pugnax]XP_014813691.1 PREDICTED: ectonucleotide pyrophosphatase/phosphodiesterase fami